MVHAVTKNIEPRLTTAVGQQQPRVFISYSRKDNVFSERLVDDLAQHGFEAYLDEKDIAPGEDWQERLGKLIAAADSIVLALSPDSMVSTICQWEVDEAERLNKRILPVVCRPVADEQVPGRIRRLNYIFMTAGHGQAVSLAKLVAALKINLTWVREHTRDAEALRQAAPQPSGGL